jgi:RND family efflux transporter MFP subunit
VKFWKAFSAQAIIIGLGGVAIYVIAATKPVPSPNEDQLAAAPKTQVAVKAANRESVNLTVLTQGIIKPRREIELVAQVAGRVVKAEKSFVSGDYFAKNSIIIEIDDRDYQPAYLSAKARLSQARRTLAQEQSLASQAKKQWRDLGNQKANDLFLRKPQLEEAFASLEYAEAALVLAELNLARTKISVPFDGRIDETYVDVGEYVTVGKPLAKVYDISMAEVRLPLTDKQMAKLNLPLGFSASTSQQTPLVTLTGTVAGKRHQWQGTIARTEAAIDINSQMYYAIAEITNPYGLTTSGNQNQQTPVLPGLFVSAEIQGKTLDDVIILPNSALVKRKNIYTLDDENKVELSPVTVLKKTAQKVWLQADIATSVNIVLDKHALLSPGTEVAPVGQQPNKPAHQIESPSATELVKVAEE